MIAHVASARLLFLSGRTDEALRVGRRGIERAEEAVRDRPRDVELRLALSQLLGSFTDIQRIGPHPELALDDARRSVAVLEEVCRQNALLFQPRLILSETLAVLSNLECDLGQTAQALRSADQAVEVARALLAQSPGMPRVRENLGVCLLAQGRARLRSGDAARALESFRQAVDPLERSAESMYMYNGACALSLASSVDDPAEPGSPEARRARRERDAARAVELLKSAVDYGLSEPSIPQTDTDLVPIQSREDFRVVIQAMKAAKADAASSGNP
jgi:tetratricopeptide (TPR) repeat protein